ncbi:MAG: GNAT family N-acetyltransferase [Coriobacteriia bacterium]|nr:GNAT family N-acetyltransferase [Coriobacteriia bacterium]
MPHWLITTVERSDPAAVRDVRALLEDYHDQLLTEVTATSLTAELSTLPAPYAPPGGVLLLARDEAGRAAGCVGVRQHSEEACEIKRLYVTPDARGEGLGRALVRAAMDHARAMGYAEMLLVAILGSADVARGIYRGLGFQDAEPFRSVTGDCQGARVAFMRRGL